MTMTTETEVHKAMFVATTRVVGGPALVAAADIAVAAVSHWLALDRDALRMFNGLLTTELKDVLKHVYGYSDDDAAYKAEAVRLWLHAATAESLV